MTLVKYSDLDFVPTTFSSMMDKFFNEAAGGRNLNKFRPTVDVVETEKHYEVQVVVPGMRKEDFNIEVNDGMLTISGERRFENEDKGKNYRTVESQFGSFARSFNLPDHINAAGISAAYDSGILKVELPKDSKKLLKTTVKVK